MEENKIKVIPAKDGWDVVYFVEGNKECPDELVYEPVIAWTITRKRMIQTQITQSV